MKKQEQFLTLLNRAIEIAFEAHRNQFDKGGMPYIFHPFRLSSKFDDLSLKIISLLHDVIEDSNVTLDDLYIEKFPIDIIEAVDALTKRKNEPYDKFIERVSNNRMALIIKIEDLKDNLDMSRVSDVNDRDVIRIKKYQKNLIQLQNLSFEKRL